MKMLRRTLATLALLCCTAAAGCIIEDDASITCNRFDRFLENCYYDCWTDWYCVDYYDSLDFDTQLWLDECADCLYSSRISCSYSCFAGGYNCEVLLADYLGLTCW